MQIRLATAETIRERLFNGLPEQPLPVTLFDDAQKEVLDALECNNFSFFVESFFTATVALSTSKNASDMKPHQPQPPQHSDSAPSLLSAASRKLTFSGEHLHSPLATIDEEESTKEKETEKSPERAPPTPIKSDPVPVPVVNVIGASSEVQTASPVSPRGPIKTPLRQFATRSTRSNSLPDHTINFTISPDNKVSPRKFDGQSPSNVGGAATPPPSSNLSTSSGQPKRKFSLGSPTDSFGAITLEYLTKQWDYKVMSFDHVVSFSLLCFEELII